MDSLLLSIVTFAPALSAVILLIFARGEDEAAALAQRGARCVAGPGTLQGAGGAEAAGAALAALLAPRRAAASDAARSRSSCARSCAARRAARSASRRASHASLDEQRCQ